MNKSELKEKEPYEAPEVLDIKPVSVVSGTGETLADPENAGGEY